MDADSAMNGPPPPTIPPFSPRKGVRVDPKAKLSPTYDANVSPPCCELLVRGVNADKKHSDVLTTVELAIDNIVKTDSILKLVDFKVRKFGRGKDSDTWFSSCYISLGRKHTPTALEGPDSEPRLDLLEQLLNALRASKPGWEIVWNPNAAGTDKRMWVRFPELSSKAGISGTSQDDAHAKILEWAKSKKIVVCKSWTGQSGITLVLADPKEVDRILARKTLAVKGLEGLVVTARTRQLEIEKPYDLVIKNVPPHHHVRNSIQIWFTNGFVDSDGDSLLDEIRTPEDDAESDSVFVSMLTWAATMKVLSSDMQADFLNSFSLAINDKYMSLPMSVQAANQIKFTSNRVEKAAEKVQIALAKTQGDAQSAVEYMQSEMKNLKNEFRGEMKALNHKIDSNHSVLTERIGEVETAMVQISRAQIAMHYENQASKEESRLRSELASMRAAWMFEPDPVVKAQYRAEVDKTELMLKEASRTTEAKGADAFLMLGGLAPPSIAPPSTYANTQSIPDSAVPVPTHPPGLPLPLTPLRRTNSSSSGITIRIPANAPSSGAVKRTFSDREAADDDVGHGVWASQHAPKQGGPATNPDADMADVQHDHDTNSIR